MATTKISDIIKPEVYVGYMAEEYPERNIFVRSGIFGAPPPEVMNVLNGGGRLINMPYWDYLARTEPVITSDDDTASITPDKITAGKDQAVKHQWAKAWSSMDLAGFMATGMRKSPEEHALSQITDWWIAAEQTMLINTCKGLFADNSANDSGDMIYSVYSDVASPTSANKFSRAAFDRACLTLGDRLGDIVAIAVHSSVYQSMMDNDDIDFVQDSKLQKDIPYYKGRLVIVDDGLPVTDGDNSDKYTCYLFGNGSIGYANRALEADYALAYERDELKGNGGGQTTMVTRRHTIMHPKGIKWTDTSCAGESPTATELATAANWDRVYARKNIKLAALEVNAA